MKKRDARGVRPSPHRTAGERLLIAGAIIITTLSVALLATSSFDDDVRANVGSSLLTAAIVGLTLVVFEQTLDSRREDRERRQVQQLRDELANAGIDSLADLIVDHIWTQWLLLEAVMEPSDEAQEVQDGYESSDDIAPSGDVAESSEEILDRMAGVPGWNGAGDLQGVHRALLWLRELMERDSKWWRNGRLLASCDAISFVATDILNRLRVNIDRESLPVRRRTIRRLALLAQRLSEAGDVARAIRFDDMAEALVFGETPIYAPKFMYFIEADDNTTHMEGFGGPAAWLGYEVAWLVDRLRANPLRLDRRGHPVERNPSDAATYRWGPLFGKTDDPNAAWASRFTAGSWFRRVLDNAQDEIRTLFGL